MNGEINNEEALPEPVREGLSLLAKIIARDIEEEHLKNVTKKTVGE